MNIKLHFFRAMFRRSVNVQQRYGSTGEHHAWLGPMMVRARLMAKIKKLEEKCEQVER